MKKSILVAFTMFLITATTVAQKVENPWFGTFNVSANMYDGAFGTEIFKLGKSSQGYQGGFGYTIIPSLAVVGHVGWNKVNLTDGKPMNVRDEFWEADLSLEYNFNNGYILPVDAKWQPFLTLGIGSAGQNDKSFLTVPFGGGVRYMVSDQLDLNLSSVYKFVDANGYQFLQNSLGIVYTFGKASSSAPVVAQVQDNDGDGVPNNEDLCPNVAGSRGTDGCPDVDGDGVADADDKCPNVAGASALGGCPDSDGDGVIDGDDACPQVAGSVNGCPDADNDGIIDSVDKCPNEAGTIATKGCPDADSDGVVDGDDHCPNEAGEVSLHGCPEADEQTKEVLALALEGVKFQSGRSVILNSSLLVLDKVVEVLNLHPGYRLKISGYTDSSGNADSNLKLSDDRAHAVEQYLIDKGIAANRLEAKGFGIENPIASNDTREGRAKNRRVEFEIVY
ncbi:MAG: OmpA family protein [Cytophagales bacterium]|nr:OmpA family protein [Cytophagales bacterium]